VTENRPVDLVGLMSERSLVSIGCDNGQTAIFHGPRSLEVGTPCEVFEFFVGDKWLLDYRVK
jgi:hypothetical protein